MLTPAFAMNQTCEIAPWKERGVNADVYGAPVRCPCRAVFKRHTANSDREQSHAAGIVYLPADACVCERDRLVYDGAEYSVLSVRRRCDLAGNVNHVEVEIE